MKIQLMIPAAGLGQRLGLDRPKALVAVAGVPLLVRTLECFRPLGLIAGAVVIVPLEHREAFERCLAGAFPDTPFVLAPGGPERQMSVVNGLARLAGDTDLVVIHDAARPFVAPSVVEASCRAAIENGAATVAIPCSDTILHADDDDYLLDTPERARLWTCQTPQTFRVSVIRDAHEKARAMGYKATDDASLVRRAGGEVKLVMGSPLNLKVTTASDLALAELILEGGLA